MRPRILLDVAGVSLDVVPPGPEGELCAKGKLAGAAVAAGAARPRVAQLTYTPTGQWTASAIVPLSSAGKITVYNSAGTSRIFLDVAGFFA